MKKYDNKYTRINELMQFVHQNVFTSETQRGAEFARRLIFGGEYSLALQEMSAYLLANSQSCPAAVLPTFRTLATELDLLDNGFVRAVLDGRREMPPEAELPPI